MYLKDDILNNVKFMYDMLEERDETTAISFEMPRYEDHVNFIINNPYKAWYIIHGDNGTPMGNIYLNQDDSWGYFIKREYQNKGYGTAAIQELARLHPVDYYYANINPSNDIALHQAEKFKGRMIQHTFKIKRDDILNLE